MPSGPRKRKNYTMDVSTLNRIATVVRDDDRIPKEQRERIVSELHKAMRGLMSFDASTIGADDESGNEESPGAEEASEDKSGPTAA